MQSLSVTSNGQLWSQVTCVCVVTLVLHQLTIINGYEEDTQGDSRRNLHSLLHKMILGQQALQRRNLATDWSEHAFEHLYADDDYYFSEPYEGLIYTKRKEPPVSGEYDTVQHTSSTLQGSELGNKQAVVDLLVLVDHGVYQEYLERYAFNKKKAVKSIKRYYTLLVHMIDSRYREIGSTDFSLRIRPSAVLVVEDPTAFQWETESLRTWMDPEGEAETVMDPHKALAYLHTWLQSHDSLPAYDHIMAFTEYTLVKPAKNRPSSGMAYISTMCQTAVGFSVSVISERGGFANVETATHELAHSLGATHDGGPGNEACSAIDGHIMAPAQALKEHYGPNYFTFSKCSIKAFHKMLSSSQGSCLYDSQPIRTSSKLPGDFYTPDKQCRHVFGPLSGECKVPGIQKEELICQNLWCKDPNDKYGCITRSGLHAVYGTLCDRNKKCYNGNCVDVDTITSFEEHINADNFHNEHIDVSDILEGGHYDAKDKTDPDSLKNKDMHLEDAKITADSPNKVENKNIDKEDLNHANPKAETEVKQKESSVEHSAKARMPHPGDRRYLAHHGKPKQGNSRKYPARTSILSTLIPAQADTESPPPTSPVPSSTAVPTAAPCTKDESASYCRNLLYTNGVQICEMNTLAAYCCYTCSFYG